MRAKSTVVTMSPLTLLSVQQPQRPGGPERALLVQVVQRNPEAAAVAEPLLEGLGHVVDREVHVLDAGRRQAADDPLDDRRRADAQQRLGHPVGDRAQPQPASPGHDHRARRHLEHGGRL